MGQDKLILEHRTKPTKKKHLDLDRDYYIKTSDTTYSSKKIVNFNDSTISITISIKTDKDTTYSYSYNISKSKDTTITYIEPIYREDTVLIAFSKVQMLKKDWFKSRRWLEPFAWIGVGAVLGVAMLPVAAIDKGNEGVKEWALVEAILIGIAAPPIFIGTRKTKYDLENKWILKTEN